MDQFRVTNRLKAIKKTSSGLIGSFNIKKNQNFLRALFFIKHFYFFCFFKSPRDKSLFISRFHRWKTSFTVKWSPMNKTKSFSSNWSCFSWLFPYHWLLLKSYHIILLTAPIGFRKTFSGSQRKFLEKMLWFKWLRPFLLALLYRIFSFCLILLLFS